MKLNANDITTAVLGGIVIAAVTGGWTYISHLRQDATEARQDNKELSVKVDDLRKDLDETREHQAADRQRSFIMYGWCRNRVFDLYAASGKPQPPEPVFPSDQAFH